MRWIVATSLKFRYLVVGFAFVLMFFGVQTLGHQKIDVFPEFAPVSVEIQTSAAWSARVARCLSIALWHRLVWPPTNQRAKGGLL